MQVMSGVSGSKAVLRTDSNIQAHKISMQSNINYKNMEELWKQVDMLTPFRLSCHKIYLDLTNRITMTSKSNINWQPTSLTSKSRRIRK